MMQRGRRPAHHVMLVALLAATLTCACNDPIAQSHIDANVPPAGQFHPLLKRELEAFFSSATHRSDIVVGYELLREGPTQSGVAYPKYYVWVKAQTPQGPLDEGAARLAAIDKTRFEVTHFLRKADIQADPAGVEQVFPNALAEDIRTRAAR
jgi:hypothetical protein